MAEEPRDVVQRDPLRDDDNGVATADASRQKSKSPPPGMTNPPSEVPSRREGDSPERRADADDGKRRARSQSPSREDKTRGRDQRRSRSRSKSRDRDTSRDLRRRDERAPRRRSRSTSRDRRGSGRDDRRRPRSRSRNRSHRDRSRSRGGRGDRRRRHRSSSRDRRRRRYSSSRSRSRSRSRRGRSRSPMYARPLENLGVPPSHLPLMAGFPNMPNMALAGGMSHMQPMGFPNMAPGVSHLAAMPRNPFPNMPNMAPGVAQMPPVNHATRSQRRLYVGGIPNPCFDFQLVEFLSSTLLALGFVQNTGRPPIIKAEIHQERGFAFIEFVDINDCTACMQLDGIIYMGSPLKIKRPKDFIQPFGFSEPVPLGPAAIAALLAQKTGIPAPGAPPLSPQ